MKYEKLADSLVSLLNGGGYDYKMFKGNDGSRTSNPYEARYFFVSNPNIMFIIDDKDNTLTIHKANVTFKVFKPMLQAIRNLTKRYFINLEVKDYNKSFSPKDFSSEILKKNYRIDNIKTESYNAKPKLGLKEKYNKNNNLVDISKNDGKVVISCNGLDGVVLPYISEELVPFIVEHSLTHGKVDIHFIRKLYKAHSEYQDLRIKSESNRLTLSENTQIKVFKNFFG